jgi:hypothetical protein
MMARVYENAANGRTAVSMAYLTEFVQRVPAHYTTADVCFRIVGKHSWGGLVVLTHVCCIHVMLRSAALRCRQLHQYMMLNLSLLFDS